MKRPHRNGASEANQRLRPHAIRVFYFDLCVRGDGCALGRERNHGSSRLMAPEEFVRGAWIDGATNAFNLARIAQIALTAPHPTSPAPSTLTATPATRPSAPLRTFFPLSPPL